MTARRSSGFLRLSRRLAAAIGLLGALVGVPVVIAVAGGAPSTHLPSGSETLRALAHPVTDHAILRSVAYVCWALWVTFTVAVIIEATAYFRHRPAPSTTGSGLRIPGFQSIAGALVLAAVLASSTRSAAGGTGGIPSLMSRPPPSRFTPAAVAQASVPLQSVAGPSVPTQQGLMPVSSDQPGLIRYSVVRYDSPWAIAAKHLGSGLRWREILDEAGASLIDGSATVAGPTGPEVEPTARTIYPGQVLLLPADAVGLPATAVAAPHNPNSPAPTCTATPDAHIAVPIPPATHAGRTRVQPPAQVTEPSHPVAPQQTVLWMGTRVADGTGDVGPVEASGLAPAPGNSSPIVPLSEVLLGAGFLASASINLLSVRRARQAGQAARGKRIPLPRYPERRTELAARIGRRDDLVSSTHRAIGALACDLIRVGQVPPPIGAVLVDASSVEVVLSRPGQPPPPWRKNADGSRWHLPLTDIPATAAGCGAEILPTLVPIGREARSHAEVLINLEATAITGVSGPAETVAGLIHGAAVAMTGLPWARSADIILVGFGEVLAACQPHVRVARSVGDLGVELRGLAVASSARLSATGAEHLVAARLAGASDGLTATIVMAPSPLCAEELSLLAEVCRHDTAVSALVAGPISAPRTLRTDTNPLYVEDLGIEVCTSVLPGADISAVNQILSIALSTADVEPDEAPYRDLAASDGSREPAPIDQSAPLVVVAVLGPLEVEGTAAEFRRPHAKEVAVYLAMHPRGVAEHQLDEAIWPERHAVKATSRDPVVSSARTALGGPEQMPHAQGQGPDKRYRTTARVETDWKRFYSLYGLGRQARAIEPLREGLALVRGRPFADVLAGPGYGWLHLEGHLHHIEAEIVDAADLACELLLAAGDAVGARWAANQGLLASPYAERLWVRLMAVADALGEAQEVERILAEMDRRLDLDGDYQQLHPETIAAYRRYSRRAGRRS